MRYTVGSEDDRGYRQIKCGAKPPLTALVDDLNRYMTPIARTSIQLVFVVVLLCVVSCAGPSVQQPVHMAPVIEPPTGIFVTEFKTRSLPSDLRTPLFRLELQEDGTFVATDLSEPEYWNLCQGDKFYPMRATKEQIEGRWVWDHASGSLVLVADRDVSFRWGLRDLLYDPTKPDRLGWGAGFLERSVETLDGVSDNQSVHRTGASHGSHDWYWTSGHEVGCRCYDYSSVR